MPFYYFLSLLFFFFLSCFHFLLESLKQARSRAEILILRQQKKHFSHSENPQNIKTYNFRHVVNSRYREDLR